jgi:hypothetical protein
MLLLKLELNVVKQEVLRWLRTKVIHVLNLERNWLGIRVLRLQQQLNNQLNHFTTRDLRKRVQKV